MCSYHTYLHELNCLTIQLRSVNGPACHINLDSHHLVEHTSGDFEIITLIE